MAFDIDVSKSYTWPVTVGIPDAGEVKKFVFEGEFKRFEHEKVAKITEDVVAGKHSDRQIAEKVLVGWSGVVVGDKPFEFNSKNLSVLLNVHGVAAAVTRAWLESISRGNLEN